MLYNKLNAMILESMKEKDTNRVNVLRLIKNELVKKEKDGVKINENVEAIVLNKMISQREDSIEQFTKAKRMDLVENEIIELDLLKEYAPKEVSDDDIIAETEKVISSIGGSITMKDMKNILSEVQKIYPTANGKIVSQVVKSHC